MWEISNTYYILHDWAIIQNIHWAVVSSDFLPVSKQTLIQHGSRGMASATFSASPK